MGDGERETNRDCGVHGVPSGLEYREAHVRGERLLRHHHGIVRVDWLAGEETD